LKNIDEFIDFIALYCETDHKDFPFFSSKFATLNKESIKNCEGEQL